MMWKLDKDAGGNTWLISPAGDWVATFSRETPSHVRDRIVADLNYINTVPPTAIDQPQAGAGSFVSEIDADPATRKALGLAD